ncbi:MAG: hypothetical protein JW894_05075 [Bacteroidales bacterium]|nr:hypothetical protein [Bacteroidales bacterium]
MSAKSLLNKKDTNFRINLFFVFILSLFCVETYSQAVYYGPDETVNKGDTIMIELRDYFGNIQWQKSYDLVNWTDIEGATNDTIYVVADSSAYYKARVTVSGCPAYNSDTANVNVIKYKRNVFVVDTNVITLVSDSLELADGLYIYENADIDDFEVGQVLVNYDNGGYLRIIIHIVQDGDQVILFTAQGRLTDLIEDGTIIDSIALFGNDEYPTSAASNIFPSRIDYLAEGASIKRNSKYEESTQFDPISISLSNFELYSGNVEGISLNARIKNGLIQFTPTIHRKLDIGIFPPFLYEFMLSAEGELYFDCDLELLCDYPLEYSRERMVYKNTYPIPIGIFVMVIELKLFVGFETSLDINGSFTTGFDATQSLEVGIDYYYNRRDEWQPIWEQRSDFNMHEPDWDLHGDVAARAYVAPRISVTFYEVVGPYLELEPYLRFAGEVELSELYWHWLLAGGVDANVGIEAEILGYSLPMPPPMNLARWEQIIAEDEGYLNTAPDADFYVDPSSGTTATNFRFDASDCSDSQDPVSALQVRWDWENNGSWNTGFSTNKVTYHQYSTPGTYTVRMQVRDSGGLTDETTRSVQVNEINTPPDADFYVDPSSGTTATNFRFDASGCSDSQDLVSVLQVRWDWENNGSWDTGFSTNKVTYHQYSTPGTYTVRMQVRDNGGLTDETTRSVQVNEENTAPDAYFYIDPSSGTTTTNFRFDASASSDGQDPVSLLQVRWDWENNGIWDTGWLTNKVEYHQYATNGTYTVRMEVRDTEGLTDETTRTVQVNEEEIPTPVIEYLSHSIDDSDGDNDGLVEPGEFINMTITLINNGDGDAHNVDVIYSTDDLYVEYISEVQDGEVYYGDIMAGTTDNNPGFTFTVSEDCPEKDVVFSLYICAHSEDLCWEDEFTVHVYPGSGATTGTVTDYDGNVYNTVKIGNQWWMAENLETTYYSDGTPLVDGTGVGSITGDYTTKYWFVYNDDIANKETYGLLYTWAAVMNDESSSTANPSGVQGVCPNGWHVPSSAEWVELSDFLGGEEVAGGKLKEIGTTHWTSPNTGATNETGFTGLPGGVRGYSDGTSYNMGTNGYHWSSQELDYMYSRYAGLNYLTDRFYPSTMNGTRTNGFSVRCVKD